MQVLYYRGVHNICFYKTSNYDVVSLTCFWQERCAITINIFKTLTGYISHCIYKLHVLTFMYIWCLIPEARQYCAVYNKKWFLILKRWLHVQYSCNLCFMLPITNVIRLILYIQYILSVRVQKHDVSCIREMLLYYSISSRIVVVKMYYHTVWHWTLK